MRTPVGASEIGAPPRSPERNGSGLEGAGTRGRKAAQTDRLVRLLFMSSFCPLFCQASPYLRHLDQERAALRALDGARHLHAFLCVAPIIFRSRHTGMPPP